MNDLGTSLSDDQLLHALSELPAIEPASDIAERFHDQAAAHAVRFVAPSRWWTVALAAALVLAIGSGWWIDRQHQAAAIVRLQSDLAIAMKSQSAVTRTQAITVAGESGAHDDAVSRALVDALVHDPNANVRVAAAEALGRIGTSATLTAVAREAVASERSPFVQAALLDVARRMSSSDRQALLRAMLAQPDLDQSLRDEASKLSDL
jgi:HEAT repeat protein